MESHEGTHNQAGEHQHHPKSTSELMSSAKLVADAAKSTFNKDPDHQVDKGRVAGAGADILEAASHYGKLEENKTYGKYVEKAENYLHQYHSSHSTTTAASTGHSEGGHTKQSETHSGGADGEKSGYGDYMKMAQGFLKSSGSDKTESHSSGGDGEKSGYGDYFKMAQGFLKK